MTRMHARPARLAGVLAFAGMLVGLPVVGLASPAGAVSPTCAALHSSPIVTHAAGFGGSLGLDAGEQLTATASEPHDNGLPTQLVLSVDAVSVAGGFPSSVSYTIPTTGLHSFSVNVNVGNVDLSLTCTPPALSAQSISFTNAPLTGLVGGQYTPSAAATSLLPVSFSLDGTSTGCSLSAGAVHFDSVGTCVIDANQAGNGSFSAAPQVQGTTVISTNPQTISFGPLGPGLLGAPPFMVSASASSGLPVSFSSDTPGACAVSGSTVTMVAAGTCTVRASQSGNTTFSPAPDVTQSFSVVVYAGGPLGDCKGPPLTAPTKLSSAPGSGSATLSWSPTQSSCVAGYVITPSSNGVPQPPILLPGHWSTTLLKGLSNGGIYTFTVAAEDGTVVGPASIPSAKITVGAPVAVLVVHVGHVSPGAVKVVFNTPRDNGSPITHYVVVCESNDHGAIRAKTGSRSPITVTGLTAGRSYRCIVEATNRRGTGPASTPSRTAKA